MTIKTTKSRETSTVKRPLKDSSINKNKDPPSYWGKFEEERCVTKQKRLRGRLISVVLKVLLP